MTLTWILTAMLLLAPGRDHSVLGNAIARRVELEPPLFRGDDSKVRTASVLVAVAFRESSLRADVAGDFRDGKPHSFCAFQIHDSSGGSADLLNDPDACVAKAFAMLRASLHSCATHPIAWYAEGPRGCESLRAQRISRDRMAIAARLVREVAP